MSDAGNETLPLAGKRILVTRTAAQADALVQPLEDLGAAAVVCPTIEIIPPENPTELDQALQQISQVDILILSSPNAVDIFFSRLAQQGLGPDVLDKITVVAVGPKTAQAIEEQGVTVDRIPADFRAEGLVELLQDDVAGRCVLYPKAGLARDLVPKELTAAGARVLDPIAYTSRTPAGAAEKIAEALAQGIDLLTFTASSTVRNLAELLPEEQAARARTIPVASIGPLTSQTARELGFDVVIEPENSTLEDMINAIKHYFQDNGS